VGVDEVDAARQKCTKEAGCGNEVRYDNQRIGPKPMNSFAQQSEDIIADLSGNSSIATDRVTATVFW
jgi:hypothetical protein